MQMVSADVSFGWFGDLGKTLTIVQQSSQPVHSDWSMVSTRYPFTVLYNFAHDFIRKLMFCFTNSVAKKNIDAYFQKMLSHLSNIFFNMITCSVTRSRTAQRKVNKFKFGYMLNSRCRVT